MRRGEKACFSESQMWARDIYIYLIYCSWGESWICSQSNFSNCRFGLLAVFLDTELFRCWHQFAARHQATSTTIVSSVRSTKLAHPTCSEVIDFFHRMLGQIAGGSQCKSLHNLSYVCSYQLSAPVAASLSSLGNVCDSTQTYLLTSDAAACA